jgi:hypothetical protein
MRKEHWGIFSLTVFASQPCNILISRHLLFTFGRFARQNQVGITRDSKYQSRSPLSGLATCTDLATDIDYVS